MKQQRYLANQFSSLGRGSLVGCLLVALAMNCSKSDSERSVGSEEAGSNRSSSAEQDESAFTPGDVAGSFLAAIQECSSFVIGGFLKIGCSLLDAKTGQHVLAKFAAMFDRPLVWTLSVDGVELPESASEPGAGLALVGKSDRVWNIGEDGRNWPTAIIPKVRAVLKDGSSLQNFKITEVSKVGLKTPPTGSKTATSSRGSSGGSGSGASFDANQSIIFTTSVAFPAPQRVLTDATVAQHFSSCNAYQQAARASYLSLQQKVTAATNAVCQCTAAESTNLDVKTRASGFYAVINVEAAPSDFVIKMQAKQVKKLYDIKHNLIANEGEFLRWDTTSTGVQSSVLSPINFDERAQDVSFGGAQQFAWTGFNLNTVFSSSSIDSPDCNKWAPDSNHPTANVGEVGSVGSAAITSVYRMGCMNSVAHYYCASP